MRPRGPGATLPAAVEAAGGHPHHRGRPQRPQRVHRPAWGPPGPMGRGWVGVGEGTRDTSWRGGWRRGTRILLVELSKQVLSKLLSYFHRSSSTLGAPRKSWGHGVSHGVIGLGLAKRCGVVGYNESAKTNCDGNVCSGARATRTKGT